MTMKKQSERLQAIHQEAMIEFDEIQSAVRDGRLQSLKDRRFYSIPGAQWEGSLGEQFENKPKFEVNKIHLAVIRIINEYRNNRINLTFVPRDGRKDDKLADVCSGLYRADEQDSCAEEAYDNAFEESVGGGIGAWRLRACNEDCEDDDEDEDEDKKQRIRFEPIYDADSSVFFDLNSKRQDKSDAKSCYVLTSMSHAAYKAEYGESSSSLEKTIHQTEFDWTTPDVCYVAEHYRKEKKKKLVHVFKNLTGEEQQIDDEEFEDDETKLQTLHATGWRKVREKKVKQCRIHKYIIGANGVLEDCGIIAGRHIPIVVTYGKRWFVDNIERFMGHVSLAKDAQMLKNMQLSKLGELAAYSPVEKPIFTPEQMAGHGLLWAEDNIKNNPYLLVNPTTDENGNTIAAGPIGYTKPPQISPAMAALLQITETDMQDLLGNQQAGEQLQPNVSGIAVELIQNKLDMQPFIYISNFKKAMRRSAQIWLSMAKDILVEEGRRMKSINEAGETSSVELMKPSYNDETQQTEYENDLSQAKFDIEASIGPTSASKRAATVRSLIAMKQGTTDPETIAVLDAMIMMNMEGEGISEVREYFRNKLIRMGAVKPTDEEAEVLAQELANQKPDANTVFLQASAKEAEAKSKKAEADTILAVARAEETKAKTAETLSKIELSKHDQILKTIDAIESRQ